MEVVGNNLLPSPCRLDGGGVDLEELIWVDGAVVLVGQVRTKLGGPVYMPQVRRECPATGPVRADVIIGGEASAHGQARGSLLVLNLAPPFLCSLQAGSGIPWARMSLSRVWRSGPHWRERGATDAVLKVPQRWCKSFTPLSLVWLSKPGLPVRQAIPPRGCLSPPSAEDDVVRPGPQPTLTLGGYCCG